MARVSTPRRPEAATRRQWLTGFAPESWRDGYTHLIRAPGDPDEKDARGIDNARRRRWTEAPHRRLATMDPDELVEAMLAALGKEALTFNAISVAAFDLTADVVFSTKVNALLWDLVEERTLEHTAVAPILFRKRKRCR